MASLNITRTQWAIGGLALASVGVLAYSLVRPTKETNKKKKNKRKGPKTAKFDFIIDQMPMELHFVMATEEGFHAHVAGDKKNKKLKFGARLFKINDKKVENLTYEEIVTQLKRVKVGAKLTFKEFPDLERDWKKAEEFRERGNEFYKKGETEKGIAECSKAIQLHPTNKVYYSNRVLMYLKINQLESALEDCQKIRELDPLSQYVKGHYLRGLVLFNLKKIKHAAAAFQTVMKLEPSFKQAKVRLDDCLKKLKVEEEKEQAKIVEKRRSSEVLLNAKANGNNEALIEGVAQARAEALSGKEADADAQEKSIFEAQDPTVVVNDNNSNNNVNDDNIDENKADNSNSNQKEKENNEDNSDKNKENENENKDQLIADTNSNDVNNNNNNNNDTNENSNNNSADKQAKSIDDSYEQIGKGDVSDAVVDAPKENNSNDAKPDDAQNGSIEVDAQAAS